MALEAITTDYTSGCGINSLVSVRRCSGNSISPMLLGSNQQDKAGVKGRLLEAEFGNCQARIHV